MGTGKNKSFLWIITTGLIVGTLDALAAIVVYSADPYRLFQFIASGAVGREIAFSDGHGSFFLGVFFHYFIATFWSGFFVVIYYRIKWVRSNRIISGLLYGVVIWIVMNMVVLRLSQIAAPTPPLKSIVIGALILMLAVGLPIALLTKRLDKNHDVSEASAS